MTTNAVCFTSLFTAVALAAFLAACSGGGGVSGDSSLSAPPTSVVVVSSAGTLNITVPSSSYAAGSMSAQAFDALNAARLASGAGELTQSTTLDPAAQAHAAYLAAVQRDWASLSTAQQAEYTSVHTEYADIEPALFYGADVGARAQRAGAITSSGHAAEGIGGAQAIVNGNLVASGASCIDGLLQSVYHADAALSPVTSVAIAQWTDAIDEPACVVDYGAADHLGQVTPSATPVVNPAPASTVQGTFAPGQETPRPAPTQIASATAGTPVLFQARTAAWVNAAATAATRGTVFAPTVSAFTITAPNGAAVDSVLLASTQYSGSNVVADDKLLEGTLVAIPRSPLAAGTYSVHVVVVIAAGVTAARDWQFVAQ